MKKHVLFVDDDPGILEGLRNRLRRQRSKWEMTFVESGREALEVLDARPTDVIVTDMRMPEMDGAALLARVQEEHPEVARIVLTGYAEMESTLRAVPIAHQFLTKPCDVGVLENVVERACALGTLLRDETVRRIVGKIETLPPVPRVYSQLTAALSDADTSIDDVSRILKQDMALCAKLLQIVNSGFFRLARTVARIEDAVSYLGFNTIKQVVLAVEVFHCADVGKTPIPLEALQNHALLVGNLASRFFDDRQNRGDAFIAGLLHDIGKLVLVVNLPEHLVETLDEMDRERCTMHRAEVRLHGVSHAEIGGYLLGLWGLPYPIVEAVANHHEPGRVDTTEFGLLAATHIADAIVHEGSGAGRAGGASDEPLLDPAFLANIGVDDKLSEWRELQRALAPETEGKTP